MLPNSFHNYLIFVAINGSLVMQKQVLPVACPTLTPMAITFPKGGKAVMLNHSVPKFVTYMAQMTRTRVSSEKQCRILTLEPNVKGNINANTKAPKGQMSSFNVTT